MSFELKASKRERLGSRAARSLRAEGKLPASIQGQGKDNLDVALDSAAFLAARRHHESLFDIDVAGSGLETAMVREIQYDAFGDNVIHVEFRRVTRGVAIDAEIDLHFVGIARGGVISPLVRTISVRAIPSKLPDEIEVDASAFSEGDTVLASDVKLPEGVELTGDPEEHVAVVTGATEMDVEPEEEPEEGAEPESSAPRKPGEDEDDDQNGDEDEKGD